MSHCKPLLLAGIALFAGNASAGSWELESSEVVLGASYNDNPALEPESTLKNGDRATENLIAQWEGDFAKLEPASSLSVQPQVRYIYYPDNRFRRLNRTDFFLRSNAAKFSQRYNSSVSLNYDNQSVLTAEDYSPGGDTGDGSSNFNRPDDKRERITLSPNLTWTPTPKDSLIGAFTLSRTDHKLEKTGRADIDAFSYSVQYQRAVTQRQSFGIVTTYSDSEATRLADVSLCTDGSFPDFSEDALPFFCADATPGVSFYPFITAEANIQNDSQSDSLSLSYLFQWSEQTQISATYGNQSTDSKSLTRAVTGAENTFDNSFKGTQYSLSIITTGERSRLDLNVSRGVSLQSDGTPSDNTEIRGEWTYRLTPKLLLKLVGAGSQRQTRTNRLRREVRFVRTDVTLSWRFNRKLSVAATYIYRNRNPDIFRFDDLEIEQSETETRKSNAIAGTLRYKF